MIGPQELLVPGEPNVERINDVEFCGKMARPDAEFKLPRSRASTANETLIIQPTYEPSELDPLDKYEIFWMEHQKWLEEKGYMLRPRYRPGWVPSWENGKDDEKQDKRDEAEDRSVFSQTADIMDATRISDNALVSMKRMENGLENEIAVYFSTEPLASHPHNHCVPIYEVLQIPDSDLDNEVIIVMPLLRPFDEPRFKDCTQLNIMMDPRPTFPAMFHPGDISRSRDFKSKAKFHTRTSRPTKYLFIDFGLSLRFEPGQDRKVFPIRGGDRTVPEFEWYGMKTKFDPFPVDVYYLGNLIREEFLQKTRGLEFIIPLVSDMVQDDPAKRPTMDEVVSRYDRMINTLSSLRLRSRLVERHEGPWFLFPTFRTVAHIYRTTIHVFTFRSPIPRPKS
ncbi:hypothetical protein NLI96_g8117 [Meripilus lineatus]|uniref:Protein kinase domain-containing protein n=1 Tax=Meripilus lineatus TaxID=2056292 RepID=A0AAD5YGK9_9APHY|nr:hypothetical protein NLI96_g8117 [Physisporinus lineatus]